MFKNGHKYLCTTVLRGFMVNLKLKPIYAASAFDDRKTFDEQFLAAAGRRGGGTKRAFGGMVFLILRRASKKSRKYNFRLWKRSAVGGWKKKPASDKMKNVPHRGNTSV